ncbi:hypothetical protein V8C86DRAFT_263234 [Haematococcus lacustris]
MMVRMVAEPAQSTAAVLLLLLLRRRRLLPPQAFESVEALLAGYTSKPSHAVFSYPVATAAFGARSVQQQGGGNTWGEPALHPAHSPGQLRHNLPSACGLLHPEDLDWSSPLRHSSLPSTALAASRLASSPAQPFPSANPSTTPATGIQAGSANDAQIAVALELGLSLAEALLAVGMQDPVRHLAPQLTRTLAPALDPASTSGWEHLVRLIACMASVGLRDEFQLLADAVAVPGVAGVGPASAALMACALSGDGAKLGEALARNGALALAAIHTRANGGTRSSTLKSMASRLEGGPTFAAWQTALQAEMLAHAGPGVSRHGSAWQAVGTRAAQGALLTTS